MSLHPKCIKHQCPVGLVRWEVASSVQRHQGKQRQQKRQQCHQGGQQQEMVKQNTFHIRLLWSYIVIIINSGTLMYTLNNPMLKMHYVLMVTSDGEVGYSLNRELFSQQAHNLHGPILADAYPKSLPSPGPILCAS